ncbi:MAG: nucleoside hydrolase, partial [Saprospiraceae bacterium]|nr:nucleoside hydrolase [Saprospiraceae bacterium]
MSRRKFFIDTDAGTDDAVALIMALRYANVDVIGISAVCGNVGLNKVVQNIGYICELCSVTIPYYAGSARPLTQSFVSADFIHGKDGLGDIGLNLTGRDAVSEDAIGALLSAIQKYPGEVELICLGPLTNIARLISAAPAILASLKKIVIMGGLVHLPGNVTPLAEFNIWADPEAAAIVLAAIQEQNCSCSMIGWD